MLHAFFRTSVENTYAVRSPYRISSSVSDLPPHNFAARLVQFSVENSLEVIFKMIEVVGKRIYKLVIWIGWLFTLGIPLASLFFRIVVNLAGGYKIPLAWTFSYYSALSIAFMAAFISIRARVNRRSRINLVLMAALLSICLGSAVGFASTKAGVLGHPLEDPSRGSITRGDAVLCAILGTFSGLGLGIGNSRWTEVLAARGLSLAFASTLCLLAAVVSVGVALSIALFLW